MMLFSWVLAALVGWTAIGLVGTVLALATRDGRRAVRGLGWIIGVWVIYVMVLLGVGRWQTAKVLRVGQEERFGKTSYAVTGGSSVNEFKGSGGSRLVQVGLRIRNGGTESNGVQGTKAYLVDARGRRWNQTPGVGGVPLTVSLPAGGEAVSEPVFLVADDAADLRLVLTRGFTGWGWLVIGDTDSLGHRRTVFLIE